MRSLTASEVLKIAKKSRPELKVALPWATLSARRAYVKDKAAAVFHQVACVSGRSGDVNLGGPQAGKHASIQVTLASTSPGELFLVVVKGRSSGRAVLRFDGDNGTAEASMEAGNFHCPFAVSPTDAESRFELTLPVDPVVFIVRAIDIRHVT